MCGFFFFIFKFQYILANQAFGRSERRLLISSVFPMKKPTLSVLLTRQWPRAVRQRRRRGRPLRGHHISGQAAVLQNPWHQHKLVSSAHNYPFTLLLRMEHGDGFDRK